MTYALRKLIAFVFLGGMFWFVYQDLDNLEKPWFMRALGIMTMLFAAFWIFVPLAVVKCRIVRRRRQNAARYAEWLSSLGADGPRPHVMRDRRPGLEPGERVYLHEKGTLYATSGAGLGEVSRKWRPSDVAFPGFGSPCSRLQRTHCYITDRRLLFVGKGLSRPVPFADVKSFADEPGGIVFEVAGAGAGARLAFTFQNPLVAAHVMRFARKDCG